MLDQRLCIDDYRASEMLIQITRQLGTSQNHTAPCLNNDSAFRSWAHDSDALLWRRHECRCRDSKRQAHGKHLAKSSVAKRSCLSTTEQDRDTAVESNTSVETII